MPSRSTGKQTPTPCRVEIRFSPRESYDSIYDIEGPKRAILPLITELRNLGYSGTYICDRTPNAKITYQIPRLDGGGPVVPEELPNSIWELFGSTSEIDILESNRLAALTEEERRIIREAINSPVAGESPALTTALAINVYLIMLKGVRSDRVTVPTLRVTRAVSTFYPILNPLVNIESIYSSATLRTAEAVPSQYVLPASGAAADADFMFGWYKKFPQIQQTGFNKFNISQEWEFGKWPVVIFGSLL